MSFEAPARAPAAGASFWCRADTTSRQGARVIEDSILGNRHVVRLNHGTLTLVQDGHWLNDDFIVHELTHVRQAQLLRQHGADKDWKRKRGGVHRDRGWYAAIAEACPKYLGVDFPQSSWPTGPRTRKGTLTEVEATHWPETFRALIQAGDPRLPKIPRGGVARR